MSSGSKVSHESSTSCATSQLADWMEVSRSSHCCSNFTLHSVTSFTLTRTRFAFRTPVHRDDCSGYSYHCRLSRLALPGHPSSYKCPVSRCLSAISSSVNLSQSRTRRLVVWYTCPKHARKCEPLRSLSILLRVPSSVHAGSRGHHVVYMCVVL